MLAAPDGGTKLACCLTRCGHTNSAWAIALFWAFWGSVFPPSRPMSLSSCSACHCAKAGSIAGPDTHLRVTQKQRQELATAASAAHKEAQQVATGASAARREEEVELQARVNRLKEQIQTAEQASLAALPSQGHQAMSALQPMSVSEG